MKFLNQYFHCKHLLYSYVDLTVSPVIMRYNVFCIAAFLTLQYYSYLTYNETFGLRVCMFKYSCACVSIHASCVRRYEYLHVHVRIVTRPHIKLISEPSWSLNPGYSDY